MASRDLAFKVGHGVIAVLALLTALFWPRAGQPALLLSLTGDKAQPALAPALTWVAAENARIESIDPLTLRIIVRAPSSASLLRALKDGILPIAANADGCGAIAGQGSGTWKN